MSLPEPRLRAIEACPVCRSPVSRERFTSPDFLLSVPGSFRYVQCEACSTVYQNPRVRDEDLALCYPAEYYTHGGSPWTPTPAAVGSLRDLLRRSIRAAADRVPDESLPRGLRLAGRLLALVPALRRRARLGLVDGLELPPGGRGRCLEVGPGLGIDLYCLRLLGWDAYGLDVDPQAAEQARATSGCEVRVGTLATTDYPAGSFDLVYMSHVFEHLPEPGPALSRCRELLAPSGRLVLVYPNPSALTVRLYGRFSCVFEPPRHFVLPPVDAAVSLLRGAGFARARGLTSTRRSASFFAASRHLRAGARWTSDGPCPPALVDRLFAAAESALVALGLPFGEEAIVWADGPVTRAVDARS